MQTITIEILDDTALAILNDLALQQMIKVQQINPTVYQAAQMKSLKGAMKKQLITDVENQLNELRNDWK
jgi:sugar-specific transcriptional regulator TrmB